MAETEAGSKTSIVSYLLQGQVWWRFPRDWEGQDFSDLGVRLLSPLRHGMPPRMVGQPPRHDGDRVLFIAPVLVLEHQSGDLHKNVLGRVIERIRIASGQVSIPRLYHSSVIFERLPDEAAVEERIENQVFYNQTFYNRALTPENCAFAAEMGAPKPPYLFLADAAEAVLTEDIQRAIIYLFGNSRRFSLSAAYR
jgi:hypothetical protein